MANSVTLRVPLTADAAPELTALLDAFFGEGEGAGWILWSAWPTPDLAPLGYTAIGEPPFMVRPPGQEPIPVPGELRIEEATDDEALAAFERAFVEGYPLPALQPDGAGRLYRKGSLGGPLRFWLGYLDRRAVTVAASCESDGVVGIYAVATLSEARGRGYGAAITDRSARINPVLPVVLQASDLGRPVYERLGFRTISRYTLWLRSRRR
jgi:hypothetical protein